MKLRRMLGLVALGGLGYLATRRPEGSYLAPGEYDFDPYALAWHERMAWQVYYQRNWPALAYHLLRLTQESTGMSLAEGVMACFYATRAQIAFAPADNDVTAAEQAMARYYELIRQVSGGTFDPAEAARLELAWWVVHRQWFNRGNPEPVAEAFLALYRYLHRGPEALLRQAAEARAQAAVYSDRWVAGPRDPADPVLDQVEDALLRSYQALHRALQS